MIDIKRKRNVVFVADNWLYWVRSFFFTEHVKGKPWVLLGKKHREFNNYAEKLRYECLSVVFSSTQNRRLKRARVSQLNYWWNHLNDIILASPDTISAHIQKWKKKKVGQVVLLNLIEEILVWYYDKISEKYGYLLVDQLNIKTCPYCNRQFIYTFKGRANERPELDHFYPKNKYPLFCISFYNLIPSCHSCNHIKLEEEIGVNPYKQAFKRPFVITDRVGNTLSPAEIYKLKKEDIRIRFEGTNKEEELNSNVLGLEDVYNKHTDYVKELIDKSMAYDTYARKTLVESFQGAGWHPRQVYDFVWGCHLMNAEYEDRPLSKLTKDILDLLDIRRG